MVETILHIVPLLSASVCAFNERTRAKTVLIKALVFPKPERFARPFVKCTRAIVPILEDLLTDHVSDKVTSSQAFAIVNAHGMYEGDGAGDNRQTVNETAILTRRGLEILRMIAVGYRNKEIAEKMFVSFPTVKNHTCHIFEKLRVNNRDRNVRRVEDDACSREQ